jgi:hypothetical protein
MNDRNSPFGPGHEKTENYLEHPPLALIRGLPATTGAANRPGNWNESCKIYAIEFSFTAVLVKSVKLEIRTDVR